MPSTVENGDDARVDGRDARWAAHRSSRRAELVRAARRAVHHRGPDLSMDDLAAEIGTSKSIIYRYFTDKSGLQSAVGAAVIEDLRAALGEVSERVTRPRDRIGAMVDVYLGIVESSAAVYAFVTQPEATATAGALRGFVAEIEDIVAEALLPVLRHGGAHSDADHALAALWGAGVVGHVRSVAERWIAARSDAGTLTRESGLAGESGLTRESGLAGESGLARESGLVSESGVAGESGLTRGISADDADAAPAVETGSQPAEDQIAAMERTELAAHITDWLWTGAAGVARRARNTSTARPEDEIGDPS